MGSDRYAARALLMLLLAAGYYLLAFAVVVLSFFLIWLQLRFAVAHPLILVFLLVAACGVLWSVLPRFERFVPPGPELRAEHHPRLFAMLEPLARAAGVRMPSQVLLTLEENAGVLEQGGLLSRRHKVLTLGLPLLEALSVQQLRAVLAHEFGHFLGGDDRIGAKSFRTFRRIERTIANLSRFGNGVVRLFALYGRFFLRVTRPLCRAQEAAADRLAARVAGARSAIEALRVIGGLEGEAESFWGTEIVPIIRAGYRPALMDLLAGYLDAAPVRERRDEQLARALAAREAHPFDSHPLLRDRISLLEGLATETAPETPPDENRATVLLDRAQAEDALLRFTLCAEYERLRVAPWEDHEQAFVTIWRADLQRVEPALRNLTADNLPAGWGPLIMTAGRIANCLDLEIYDEEGKALARQFVGEALSLLLHARGWTLRKIPGQGVVLSNGTVELDPFRVLGELSSMQRHLDDWTRFCEDAGLAGVALTDGLAAVEPERQANVARPAS